MLDLPVREARLRAAFAHLYPDVEPDVWLPAGEVADLLRLRITPLPGGESVSPRRRVLPPEHFEFRNRPVLQVES